MSKEEKKEDILKGREIELSYIRKVGNYENNEVENELVFFLPVGCFWARTLGGCYHCGFQDIINEITRKYYCDLVEIVKVEYKKYLDINIKRVFFYVGGSFFEIKDEVQNEILSFISAQSMIKDIYIESRPEFITKENIQRLKFLLQAKNLVVAIGLETYSEKIRNEVLTKGISNNNFELAMYILKSENVKALVYIFIKPPIKNISDKKAYEDVLKSLEFVVERGVSCVELKSGCITYNTKAYELYKAGQYTPLNIWTVNKLLIEANERYKNIPIRLGIFNEIFSSIDVPKGCILCDEFLKEKLQLYRETMDYKVLTKYTTCYCSII